TFGEATSRCAPSRSAYSTPSAPIVIATRGTTRRSADLRPAPGRLAGTIAVASVSLTTRRSIASSNSCGRGRAGAALSTRSPCARVAAATTVSIGTSSWNSTASASPMTALSGSVSVVSAALAPGMTTMLFWASSSTTISAVPDGPRTVRSALVSTPASRSVARIASAYTSSPTAAIIAQRAPARAAAIAWLEPFPPTIVASERAITVSPGRGSAAPRATRSMLQLPTTATRAAVTSDPARASRAVHERERTVRERVECRAVEPAQARRDPTLQRARPRVRQRRGPGERADDASDRGAVRVGVPTGGDCGADRAREVATIRGERVRDDGGVIKDVHPVQTLVRGVELVDRVFVWNGASREIQSETDRAGETRARGDDGKPRRDHGRGVVRDAGGSGHRRHEQRAVHAVARVAEAGV